MSKKYNVKITPPRPGELDSKVNYSYDDLMQYVLCKVRVAEQAHLNYRDSILYKGLATQFLRERHMYVQMYKILAKLKEDKKERKLCREGA